MALEVTYATYTCCIYLFVTTVNSPQNPDRYEQIITTAQANHTVIRRAVLPQNKRKFTCQLNQFSVQQGHRRAPRGCPAVICHCCPVRVQRGGGGHELLQRPSSHADVLIHMNDGLFTSRQTRGCMRETHVGHTVCRVEMTLKTTMSISLASVILVHPGVVKSFVLLSGITTITDQKHTMLGVIIFVICRNRLSGHHCMFRARV